MTATFAAMRLSVADLSPWGALGGVFVASVVAVPLGVIIVLHGTLLIAYSVVHLQRWLLE